MMKYMVSVSRKNWGNWPFRRGKMLKKRKKIRKFHSKNLATMPLVLFWCSSYQHVEQNRPKFLGLKNQAIRKIPKKKTVRTPRENWKIFQIQTKKQNRQTFWRIKNLLKQTRRKTLVTIPRKNWKIFQIQTNKLMDKRWTIATVTKTLFLAFYFEKIKVFRN